uniref:uncharacterized protein LOC109972962 n=1 Tax=Monopterus albus TaxID=43700 RepID=UPI0009B2F7E5|nr:uncharacterized protein LOC109972962 [Monopterus albus]
MELGGALSLSRRELLRGVIAEKLTAAAQEIFAAVEKTVAQYEEAASGYRKEIDRQRKQLEGAPLEVKVETTVFKKYRARELRCPCGLQEAEFLDLLRSTFPQLAPDKPFDVFITDHSRKLQPLKAETLTPEEIYRTISSAGYSSLYIHLKKLQASEEDLVLLKRRDTATDPPTTPDQTRLNSRVQSDRRRPGRPVKIQSSINLRMRILEDSQLDVLSNTVFKKYPVQELQCPCGLQEVDFLDLLRSTLTQLAPDKPFDIFMTDRSRRLQPLGVETLTPEEIYRSSKFSRLSTLCLRLKAQEVELHCLQKKVAQLFHPLLIKPD